MNTLTASCRHRYGGRLHGAPMAACGKAGGSKFQRRHVSKGFAIGLSLPETQTTRYETVDTPLIEEKIKAAVPASAHRLRERERNANTQQQQVDTLINDGDKVIILDAVDSKAIQPSVEKAHRGASRSWPTTASPRARSTPTPRSTTPRSVSSRARACSPRWAPRPPGSPRSS